MTFVADKTNIHESNLKRWIKKAEGKKQKSKKGRRINFPELDHELIKFIMQRRNNQKPISSTVIFVQSKSIKKPSNLR